MHVVRLVDGRWECVRYFDDLPVFASFPGGELEVIPESPPGRPRGGEPE